MTVAFAMFAFAGIAQAEEVRIGSGVVRTGDNGYFDTYPGSFCGIKAVRIAAGRNANGNVGLGRIYFSYAPNQPWIFSAYTHASSGLVKVPQLGCLNRVRVYFDAREQFPDSGHYQDTFHFTVYGIK